MQRISTVIDDGIHKLRGRLPSYRELRVFEALGWVKRTTDEGKLAWEITAFGALLPRADCLSTNPELSNRIEADVLKMFAASVGATIGVEKYRAVLATMLEQGLLCCVGRSEGGETMAVSAKGLFLARRDEDLSRHLRKIFAALEDMDLMKCKFTSGTWLWNPTERGEARGFLSTEDPAISILLGLELGGLLQREIDSQVEKLEPDWEGDG